MSGHLCLSCGSHRMFLYDAVGSRVMRRDGETYVEVSCSMCGSGHALVMGLDSVKDARWICSLETDPCGMPGCMYCDP